MVLSAKNKILLKKGGIMEVNVFLGSKGGIGKTRCVISAVSKYLFYGYENQELSVFDANTNNQDSYTLLSAYDSMDNGEEIKSLVRKGKSNDSFKMVSCHYKIDGIREKTVNVYRRFYPYDLPFGIVGFWRNVRNLVRRTFKDDVNQTLIIDTNLTLANLVSDKQSVFNGKKSCDENSLFDLLDELKDYVEKINLWYVWSIADFASTRDYTVKSIAKNTRRFKDVSHGLFDPVKNLYHIINPYLFFSKKMDLNRFLITFLFSGETQKFLKNKKIDRAADSAMGKTVEMIVGSSVKTITKIETSDDHLSNIAGEIAGNAAKISYEKVVKVVREILVNMNNDHMNRFDPDLLLKINQAYGNIIILELDEGSINFLSERLMMISKIHRSIATLSDDESRKKLLSLDQIHLNEFGEKTLWPKFAYNKK